MGWQDTFTAVCRDERFVLSTIGVITFAIVTTMMTTLTIIRDDNVLTPPQPKTQYITQDTEDALHLDTLEKLLDHPNFSIREIATKILCDRAINDTETTMALLYGATKPDYNERLQSLRALAVLAGPATGAHNLTKLHNEKAYSALVRSLELSLDDNPPLDVQQPMWDEYYLRDMAEKICLMFLSDLAAQNGATRIVKAKFVEKWLSRQAWGTEPTERRRNFQRYMMHRNNRLVLIVQKIKQSKRGLRALERAGLIDKEYSRRGIKELPDVIMELNSADLDAAMGGPNILRAVEHSAEEQRLRRQHREAMVLNDGSRPFGRDDIIERVQGPATEGVD